MFERTGWIRDIDPATLRYRSFVSVLLRVFLTPLVHPRYDFPRRSSVFHPMSALVLPRDKKGERPVAAATD